MKKISLSILFFLTLLIVNAQSESFRKTFLEANTLMEESQYEEALKKWLQLHQQQPENTNVNYRVGKCYIQSANNKKKALNYLIKAAQNTTGNFNPYTSSEKRAPNEAYFFLGRAYHINYQFDNAIVNYNSFKEKISTKHYLYDEIDHHIEQCKNAKIAVKNPVNISVQNMGKMINSIYADYSPALSVDESTIYFTSRRIRPDSSNTYVFDESDGNHFEDIYVAYKSEGEWSQPELLNINTDGHEATINISADGQTLFIYKDDNGDGNIYTSRMENQEWSSPIKLGSDINLSSQETHAHISPDGNTLYFISDRKKGFGGKDIYFCNKLPDGKWAKAQNFGDIINTPYDEDGVFVHPSGRTIYFSSKGHKSIGGYDIFYSTIDDLGNWSKPINLGYPVNSTDDDVFFVTSADGKRGYFSSFKEKGIGEKDIYKISLDNVVAEPLTLLLGSMKIVGQNTLPDDAIVIVTDKSTGEEIGQYVPRKRDGKFSIILTPGTDYNIAYSAGRYKMEESLYIQPTSAYQEINRAILLDDVIFNDENGSGTSITNRNNTDDVNKLKQEITDLKSQIKILESQLGANNNSNGTSTNSNDVIKLQQEVDDLKNQIKALKSQNSGPYVAPKPAVIEGFLASYQEFFNYNIKDINTSDGKYVNMIDQAIVGMKRSGKIIIDIESSASKVPTRTYGTNTNLAKERSKTAQETVINSLIEKGISKEDIIINDVSSKVKGPQYNGDYNNTGIYEQYQYIIIKIK